jgi:NDP-sugar pyrophosphorylase family protein
VKLSNQFNWLLVPKMNLLILCAGRGSRLRPLTNTIPKSLLTLDEENTILLRLLKQFCLYFKPTNVWINVSTHAPYFIDYVAGVPENLKPTILYENELLGSANTVFEFFESGKDNTLIVHGDLMLSDRYIYDLMTKIGATSLNTVVCHSRIAKQARSRISVNESNKVMGFQNNYHSLDTESVLVNSGIYFFRDVDSLGNKPPLGVEISDSILNHMIQEGTLFAQPNEEQRVSIDSPDRLREAQLLILREKSH